MTACPAPGEPAAARMRPAAAHLPAVVHKGCGTLRGAIAHHEEGESLCGWCARAHQYERLLSELAAPLPPSPGRYGPVTEAEAAVNRLTLDREVEAWEREHLYRQQRGRAA